MKKSRIGTKILSTMLLVIMALGDPMSVLAETETHYREDRYEASEFEAASHTKHSYEVNNTAYFDFDKENKQLSGKIFDNGSELMKSLMTGNTNLGYIGKTAGGRTVWTTDPSTDYFSGNPVIYVGDEKKNPAGNTAKKLFENVLKEIPIFRIDNNNGNAPVDKWKYIEVGKVSFDQNRTYVGSSVKKTDFLNGGELTDTVIFKGNVDVWKRFHDEYDKMVAQGNGNNEGFHIYNHTFMQGECIPVSYWTASANIESVHHEVFTIPKEKEGKVNYANIGSDVIGASNVISDKGNYQFNFYTKGTRDDVKVDYSQNKIISYSRPGVPCSRNYTDEKGYREFYGNSTMWRPTCAICGRAIKYNFYGSVAAMRSLPYLEVGSWYLYSCRICGGMEQCAVIPTHHCIGISPNMYILGYDANVPSGRSSSGHMGDTNLYYGNPIETTDSHYVYLYEGNKQQVVKNVADCGFTVDGYTFIGWNTKANGTGTWFGKVGGNTTEQSMDIRKLFEDTEVSNTLKAGGEGTKVKLYAQWVANSSTLEVKVNPTTWGKSGSYNGTTPLTGTTGQSVTLSGVTLPAGLKVNFNGNGGTAGTSSLTTSTSLMDISITNSTWGAAAGTYNKSMSTSSIGNYTFSSKAGAKDTITISFQMDPVTLPTATRSGYSFLGWYTAASGGTYVGKNGNMYTPTSDGITLYAQWGSIKFDVQEVYYSTNTSHAYNNVRTSNGAAVNEASGSYTPGSSYASRNATGATHVKIEVSAGTPMSYTLWMGRGQNPSSWQSIGKEGSVKTASFSQVTGNTYGNKNTLVDNITYSGTYTITAYGGAGGSSGSNVGGKGGTVSGTYFLIPGDKITYSIGGGGAAGTGAGAGGSYTCVTLTRGGTSTTLMVAGGGGGASSGNNGGAGGATQDTSLASGSPNAGGSGVGNQGGGGGGGNNGGAAGEAGSSTTTTSSSTTASFYGSSGKKFINMPTTSGQGQGSAGPVGIFGTSPVYEHTCTTSSTASNNKIWSSYVNGRSGLGGSSRISETNANISFELATFVRIPITNANLDEYGRQIKLKIEQYATTTASAASSEPGDFFYLGVGRSENIEGLSGQDTSAPLYNSKNVNYWWRRIGLKSGSTITGPNDWIQAVTSSKATISNGSYTLSVGTKTTFPTVFKVSTSELGIGVKEYTINLPASSEFSDATTYYLFLGNFGDSGGLASKFRITSMEFVKTVSETTTTAGKAGAGGTNYVNQDSNIGYRSGASSQSGNSDAPSAKISAAALYPNYSTGTDYILDIATRDYQAPGSVKLKGNPVITGDKIQISWDAVGKDSGNSDIYAFKLEGINVGSSTVKYVNIRSQIAGYYYGWSKNEPEEEEIENTFDDYDKNYVWTDQHGKSNATTAAIDFTQNTSVTIDKSHIGDWFMVAAVDVAGNIGPTSYIQIKGVPVAKVTFNSNKLKYLLDYNTISYTQTATAWVSSGYGRGTISATGANKNGCYFTGYYAIGNAASSSASAQGLYGSTYVAYGGGLPSMSVSGTNSTFYGWNTKPDGSGTKVSSLSELTSVIAHGDVTLYAIWSDPVNITVAPDETIYATVSRYTGYNIENGYVVPKYTVDDMVYSADAIIWTREAFVTSGVYDTVSGAWKGIQRYGAAYVGSIGGSVEYGFGAASGAVASSYVNHEYTVMSKTGNYKLGTDALVPNSMYGKNTHRLVVDYQIQGTWYVDALGMSRSYAEAGTNAFVEGRQGYGSRDQSMSVEFKVDKTPVALDYKKANYAAIMTFSVNASDYADEEYGLYTNIKDTSGIKEVHLYMIGTMTGQEADLIMTSTKVDEKTMDDTPIKATYSRTVNLASVLPNAGKIKYVYFAIDNAGNVTVSDWMELGEPVSKVTFNSNKLAYLLSYNTISYSMGPDAWKALGYGRDYVPATGANAQDCYYTVYYAKENSTAQDNGNGGIYNGSTSVSYGGGFPVISATTNSGFRGWNTEPNGSGTMITEPGTALTNLVKDGDVVLYAIWSDPIDITLSNIPGSPTIRKTAKHLVGDIKVENGAIVPTYDTYMATASDDIWSTETVVATAAQSSATGVWKHTQCFRDRFGSLSGIEVYGGSGNDIRHTATSFGPSTIGNSSLNDSLYDSGKKVLQVDYRVQGTFAVSPEGISRSYHEFGNNEKAQVNNVNRQGNGAVKSGDSIQIKVDRTPVSIEYYKMHQERLEDYKVDEVDSAMEDGFTTKFEVWANDYARAAYGEYVHDHDTSGIKGVYIYVFDAADSVNGKLYEMAWDSSDGYQDYTLDGVLIAGKYVLEVDLYSEFPEASMLQYKIFTVDNAGNFSNTDDSITPGDPDPDVPFGPGPGDDPIVGRIINFSIKTAIYNDTEDVNEGVWNVDVDNGETYFKTGEIGHVDVWTVGYVKDIQLDFGVMGKEAKQEILDGKLPAKYNMGIKESGWERKFTWEKGVELPVAYFTYYDTVQKKTVRVNRGTAQYNSLIVDSDGVPYARHYTMTKYSDGRPVFDDDAWGNNGVAVRVPPYYIPPEDPTHTKPDGTPACQWEIWDYTASTVKNGQYGEARSTYITWDVRNNDVHYRTIHEKY